MIGIDRGVGFGPEGVDGDRNELLGIYLDRKVKFLFNEWRLSGKGLIGALLDGKVTDESLENNTQMVLDEQISAIRKV